jgi:hypothetical protein
MDMMNALRLAGKARAKEKTTTPKDFFLPRGNDNALNDALNDAKNTCITLIEANDKAANFACDECRPLLTDYDGVVLVPRGTEATSPLAFIENLEAFLPRHIFSVLGAERDKFRSWPAHVVKAALALLCHECHLSNPERPPSVHFGLVDEPFIQASEVVPVAPTVDTLMMVAHVQTPPHYALLQLEKPKSSTRPGVVTIWDTTGTETVHIQRWSRHIGAIIRRHWPEVIEDRSGAIGGRATRQSSNKAMIQELPPSWKLHSSETCPQRDGFSCGSIVLNRLAYLLRQRGVRFVDDMESLTQEPPETRTNTRANSNVKNAVSMVEYLLRKHDSVWEWVAVAPSPRKRSASERMDSSPSKKANTSRAPLTPAMITTASDDDDGTASDDDDGPVKSKVAGSKARAVLVQTNPD